MRRSLYYPEVPEWVKDAECARYPAEMFFPRQPDKIGEAAKVCAVCPVVAECLDHALTNGIDHGTWGGKTPKQRRRLLREAK